MPQRPRWLLVLAVTLAVLGSAGAVSASPVATVQAASGVLTVERSGATDFTPLAVRGALYVGDIVGTGHDGKATLLFNDQSQVRLNADSAIEILTPAPVGRGKTGLFRALSGELWARLRPGKAAVTRSAIAGVRGTEFHLRVEADGTTTVTVLEGEVDFSNSYGAVVVGESQQSVARPDAAPTAPVTIQNPALIIEWTLDLERAIVPREKFFLSPDHGAPENEAQRRSERARSQPEDPQAHREYGDALFDDGKLADALREYQEANRLAPNPPATLARLGDTLLQLGRVDEAESSFRAAFASSEANSAIAAPALVGLAWVALTRNRPAEAQKLAEQAVAILQPAVGAPPAPVGSAAVGPGPAEAEIALGLSWMRQPGGQSQAAQAFRAAMNLEPKAYHYQAQAWLAMVDLAQNDPAAALQEAQAAVQSAPGSALAHGNLALVDFFNHRPRDAEREARRATELNPDSVSALCALGQALLAEGDVDAAEEMAAHAVALDPGLAQARYLLGVADAQRGDFRHAVRELEACRRLAPDFLPAASALARVYTRMGRRGEAVALLNDLPPGHRDADEVHAALGAVYYEQGSYAEAERQYREALRLRPNSALYHAELARLLLDANRLNDSIIAGQQAVRLAPEVGQYHALLGLAYEFSRLSVQSEREFRQAIALEPRNALAHLVRGLAAEQFDPQKQRLIPKQIEGLGDLLTQGLQAVSSSPAVSSITQAFLYDPAVSTQILRGGIRGEGSLSGGDASPLNLSGTHRAIAMDGALHALGVAERDRDNGSRPNDDSTVSHVSENVTYLQTPKTSLFARFSHLRVEQGLPGPVSAPDLDDRTVARDTLLQFGMRQRIGRGNDLWLGLTRPTGSFELTNPDHDHDVLVPSTTTGQVLLLGLLRQDFSFRDLVPEARLELTLNREPTRPTILTLGAAYARLEPSLTADLFYSAPPPNPSTTTTLGTRLDGRLTAAYAQLTQRVSDRLSLAAQLRQQRLATTTTQDLLGGGSQSASQAQSRWLPSLLLNYQAGARTLLRLFFNRQAQSQELTVLAFRPTETLLATEPLVMPQGLPSRTETVETDLERYLSSGEFLKLFVFRTTAHDVTLGDLPPMGRIERNGVGLRYERQLSRNLYGQVAYLYNRTKNRTPFAPFDNGTAPYHAPYLAGLALNYIDRAGTKLGLQLNYTGRFFEDTGDLSASERPIFPARTYVDVTIAREPSLHKEFFIKVTNLFNSRAIQFNDFPSGARRLLAGVTLRF